MPDPRRVYLNPDLITLYGFRHPSNGSTLRNANMHLSYAFQTRIAPPDPAADLSKDVKEVEIGGVAGSETSSFWQRLLSGTKLTVGVNNAFDRDPPPVLGAFNDNYDTSLYSIRNRYYYISLTKRF